MKKEKICCIYKITNKINGKVYIGQSRDVYERWRHEKQIKRNNIHLKKSMLKYGIDNFDFSILEECSETELDKKEIEYIELYKSTNPKYGYNIELGGSSNINWYLSKTDDEKAEINKRRSLTQKGRKKKISAETRKKLSDIMKRRVASSKKKVYCLETNMIYESIMEAAKKLNINDDITVSRCCNGKHNTASNYHFCWAEEKNSKQWDLESNSEKTKRLFGKKLKCIELGLVFLSLREAESELVKLGFKVNRKGINLVCNLKQKKCGGLSFEFVE